MSNAKFIHLTDVTLRDGSYGIMHQYTKKQVADITKGLSDAGVKIIEVGHGDGVGSIVRARAGNGRYSACDALDRIAQNLPMLIIRKC